MSTVQVEVPEETLVSLNTDPGQFAEELRVLAAVKLFEMGRLSSGRAAQLAGMSRVAFLMSLKRYEVSPSQIAREGLQQDIANA